MLVPRLFSFNTKLCSNFVKHIENTNNLCVYKLGSYPLPTNLLFPKADTLTLINCNKKGIQNILNPAFFPSLKKVNYLSVHPGDYEIYKRFGNQLEWVFPNKRYDFYDYMMSLGSGKKDVNLIHTYIKNKQIIDGTNDFDISYKFDLNIPNYLIVVSELYKSQFYEYLVKKQNEKYDCCNGTFFIQELEELHLQREVVNDIIISEDFETIDN